MTVTTLETSAPTSIESLLGRAHTLVAPAVEQAVAALPEPEARVAGYHRGRHGPGSGPLPVTGHRAGGKAVRPALAFLAARAVGGTAEAAIPGAVAVELVHDFSLLHDDVIDGDPLRRHRPAAWTVYGVPAAVLTGDALLVAALRTVRATPGPTAHAAVGELLDMLGELLVGQSMDVAFEKHRQVGVEQYLAMAAGKTGALMGCACAVGGVLAGARPERVEGLRDFGRSLGVAYQCVDDLLGIWGSSERSGKPVGADLAARKKSLPVVAALGAGGPASERLAELYGLPQPLDRGQIALAAELVEEAGGRQATEREAARHTALAMRALSRAEPDAETYRQLEELARMLTSRDR
ncbi:polyprenyl synthetase family protein [Streptomyces exfoliatus]|uniref:polyprenyl synthetase family protein n=1 Tax=Streptomyces exfoliatus TaxID=1905 RepID=UPI003C2F7F55